MTKKKLSRGLMTAVIVGVFGLGYVCGSMTQRQAEAQIGGLLENRLGRAIWFFASGNAGSYHRSAEEPGYF